MRWLNSGIAAPIESIPDKVLLSKHPSFGRHFKERRFPYHKELTVLPCQVYWCERHCCCPVFAPCPAARAYSEPWCARVIVGRQAGLISISEYWHYLDRPETFARYVTVGSYVPHRLTKSSIGKSDDEVGRMLEVLRFWFTKDLV